MHLVRTLAEYDALRAADRCVVVPTMGALHAGHGALVRQGATLAAARGLGGCVVTIFVNPTQFNDPADYARYPKTLDADAALCEAAGANVVFVPDAGEVYPGGPRSGPPVPPVGTTPGLEDARRPGHFAGVCQVVTRLFEMVRPVAAVFGEKDWQQLQVVRAMGHGVGIVAGTTVREADGLAMSSRNRFLSPEERARAGVIFQALKAAGREKTPVHAEAMMAATLEAAGLAIEYAVVLDATTLRPFAGGAGRALIAVRLGAVRLIDNAAWPDR